MKKCDFRPPYSTEVYLLAGTSPLEIQRVEIPASIIVNEYRVSFYRAESGHLEPIQGEGFRDMALDHYFIIGIFIGDKIHAIYDSLERQIFLVSNIKHEFVHTLRIPQSYQHYFVRLRPPSPTRSGI